MEKLSCDRKKGNSANGNLLLLPPLAAALPVVIVNDDVLVLFRQDGVIAVRVSFPRNYNTATAASSSQS